MINETILAIIIAFAVSAILCPIVIPFLHKAEIWTAGPRRRPTGTFKKAGNSYYGRPGILNCRGHYVPVIYP